MWAMLSTLVGLTALGFGGLRWVFLTIPISEHRP